VKFALACLGGALIAFVVWEEIQSRRVLPSFWNERLERRNGWAR
jgi:hypothetical protein